MPTQPKKIPIRQCIGCRERRPKRELVRVVRSPEGVVSLDRSGKANGRGAYLCRDAACLHLAVKSNALARALEATVPESVLERLAKELEQDNGSAG